MSDSTFENFLAGCKLHFEEEQKKEQERLIELEEQKKEQERIRQENIKLQAAGHLPTIDANGNYAVNYNTGSYGHQDCFSRDAQADSSLRSP